MKLEDLAEVIGDEHGVDQADMEAALLEQLDQHIAGGWTLFDLFRGEDVVLMTLTKRGEAAIRAAIANQFGGA